MDKPSSTSRRDFLRATLLTSAIFGADASLTAGDTRKAAANSGQAKNVIFMVSDGMNHGALSLANMYRHVIEQKPTNWETLYRTQPVARALAETYSANSVVTDSAAAASAWGCGHRVNNGTLNILPDGSEATTMHQKMQAAGRKTGLVTTATITHATPAGFAVNMGNRGKEEEIAQQYLERKVDVLLGGGQQFFSPELRQKYIATGYDYAEERDGLLKLSHNQLKPLLGVFSSSHIPFSIDRNNDAEIAAKVPTLSELAQVALDRLSHASNGFFLMIEGARIDHAGHQNDAVASIHDQIAFDETIGTVLKFIEKNPDTLLIITTDHGCGGIQMNGMNKAKGQTMSPGIYGASTASFEIIKNFTHSFEWMKRAGIAGLSGDKLRDELKKYTGIELTTDELKDAQGLNLTTAKAFQPHHGIGWTSGNHTGDLVEFCAFGPGSSSFPAFIENRDVHNHVLSAMGIA